MRAHEKLSRAADMIIRSGSQQRKPCSIPTSIPSEVSLSNGTRRHSLQEQPARQVQGHDPCNLDMVDWCNPDVAGYFARNVLPQSDKAPCRCLVSSLYCLEGSGHSFNAKRPKILHTHTVTFFSPSARAHEADTFGS
jgi:hypothetical protein